MLTVKVFVFPFLFVCFVLLGLHLRHMEVPRLGAYTTATAMPDPSCVCKLRHSSQQPWTLSPLSKARDRTHNLMVPSPVRFHCATPGTPIS